MTSSNPASSEGGAADATRKGKSVGAVVNASQVLRYLQSTRSPATATQITRHLELNPSTCFNILRTLIDEDFVEFNEASKTYTLSLGLLTLARDALEMNSELQVLQPKLQDFALRHRVMTAVLRRINKDRNVMVAVAESDAPIRIHGRRGIRSPLLLGAAGRVFAAYSNFSEAEIKARFEQLRLARFLDFQTFLAQVAEVRETGWALDDGYYYPGTVSIAAPVFDADGQVTLCCSAIMFNGQYDPKKLTSIAQELVDICRSAGQRKASAAAPQALEAAIFNADKARAPVRRNKAAVADHASE